MKILLAVDGSAYTQKMLAYLTSHQEMLGTGHEYTIITVQPLLPPARCAGQGSGGAVLRRRIRQDPAARAGVPEGAWRRGAKHRKVGPIADTIIHAAQDGKFDLIAMGTHGHGALGRLVMGSVSSQVLAGCTIPVLLIR
jgi:nucleotide-binding universal stress UspA family protein